jgi:hypothetical protein
VAGGVEPKESGLVPRIRTIKPELWQDEKLAALPPLPRLVFIGLISMADDAGRLVDNVKSIDGFIFPETDDSAKESLGILARLSRVLRYTAPNGQKCIQIVNWTRHQKVDHPNKYVLPAPPPELVAAAQDMPVIVETRESVARVSRDVRATTSTSTSTPTSTPTVTTAIPTESGEARLSELSRGQLLGLVRKCCASHHGKPTEAEMSTNASVVDTIAGRGWSYAKIGHAVIGTQMRRDRGEIGCIPAGAGWTLKYLLDATPDVDPLQVGLNAYHEAAKPPPEEKRKGSTAAIGDVLDFTKFAREAG